MDSGTDHIFFESNLIPGIEEIMRDVRVLQTRTEIEAFDPKRSYWVNSGILQLNTRKKDENWMVRAINAIAAPGTDSQLFSKSRAA